MPENINKELLKKYQVEFLHWLNGGAVWRSSYSETRGWHWHKWDTNTQPNWTQPLDEHTHFVVDDAYHVYRKAMAEGKTVRWQNGHGDWPKVTSAHHPYYGDVTEYSIGHQKPAKEELGWTPKKGGWVRSKHSKSKTAVGNILRIHDDGIIVIEWGNGHGNSCMKAKDLDPWDPQDGELVVSYQHSDKVMFTVTKYCKALGDRCEPFIGKVPERYKEKDNA